MKLTGEGDILVYTSCSMSAVEEGEPQPQPSIEFVNGVDPAMGDRPHTLIRYGGKLLLRLREITFPDVGKIFGVQRMGDPHYTERTALDVEDEGTSSSEDVDKETIIRRALTGAAAALVLGAAGVAVAATVRHHRGQSPQE
jgi:hypothetical protein